MIKTLLNRLFQKKETNKSLITDNEFIPKHNSIVFWTDKDGLPYLKIYIVDTNIESSDSLADILYGINTGQYISSIIDIMVNISKQDNTINNYIISVFNKWQNLIDKNIAFDIDDEPHIKPTTFNSIINEQST